MDINNNQVIPEIGAPLAGGYFAGINTIGSARFALIVSPKALGTLNGAWNSSDDSVPGAESYSDGMENTVAMAEAGSELAQEALALTIDGHSDWYIPARDELELVYRNLKPLVEDNSASFRDGDNPSSSPVGYPYTEALPAQTSVTVFQEGGAEALEADWHWSSTQYAPNPSRAWGQVFNGGYQGDRLKSCAGRARAVRRFKI